jgi:uncharacterized membrane protein
MDHVWAMFGSCLGHVCVMFGSCLGHVWTMLGLCLDHVSVMFVSFLAYFCAVIGPLLGHVFTMFGPGGLTYMHWYIASNSYYWDVAICMFMYISSICFAYLKIIIHVLLYYSNTNTTHDTLIPNLRIFSYLFTGYVCVF